MTRDEVLRRARVWVDAGVAYSQARWAREDGSILSESVKGYRTLGYRTDCSGFVSMSLGLTTTQGARLSLDTSALPTRLKKISKSQLKPGDIILRPRTLVIDGKQVPYGHAAVFVRWTDASKTRYVAYQQSSARKGAVASEVRYPFNGLPGFSAYRYKGIVEGRLRRSITWESPLDQQTPVAQRGSVLSTDVGGPAVSTTDSATGVQAP